MKSIKSHQNGKQLTKFYSIEWLTNQAVAKHKEGKSEEAIAYYLEVIELDSNQPAWVYGNVITLLAQIDCLDEGLELGEKAFKFHPESEEIYLGLALLYEYRRNTSKSIKYYQETIRLKAEQPIWVYCKLVEQLLEEQKIEEAVSLSHQAIKLHENSFYSYYILGKSLGLQQKWDEAITAYQNTLKLNPNFVIVQQKIDNIIKKKAKNKTKIEFNHLVKIDSRSSKDYLVLGDRFFSQESWEEAIKAYESAINLDDNQVWAYYNLGRVLAKQNKIAQAIIVHYKAIKIAPEFPEVYPTIGDLLYEQQRWEEAKKAYKKAIQINPNLIWSQYNLGRTLLILNKTNEAAIAYLKAIEIDNKFTIVYPSLVNLLDKQQLWEQVVNVCHKSLEHNPDWHEAYLYLGKAQNQLGRFEEAINTYNLAYEIFSEISQIYEGLGDAYRHKSTRQNLTSETNINLKKKSLDYYNQALSIKPNNATIYHKILAIEPENSIMYARLAKVLETQDQLEGAIQFYQIAKTICPENLAFSLQLYRPIEQKNKNLSRKIKASDVIDIEQLQRELILRCDSEPLVSVIIPVYNKIGYTLNCLKSLEENISSSISVEIIVVDDGSSDETQEILEKIVGLKYIKNPENMGFIKSCNNGASHAKGKYLCFLNNDTEVCPNWLESMIGTIEQDEKIGIVGSKLVYPNGMLQEAGGVVWSNASGWNYGRIDNPDAPEYNYMREVDYCSGASLLVSKAIFDSLDGFEKEFAPAYYEDTDLCFAVRNQLGLKVVYQPKSQIIHYEGISSGTSTTSGVKKYQAINSVKFADKWQNSLANHCKPGNSLNPLIAPRRFSGQKVVLMIEHDIPFYDKESGYRRIFELIKILKALNCHIIYVPDRGNPEEPYTSELQNMGVEVLYRHKNYQVSIEEQIKRVLPIVDIAWICRPDLNQKYAWLVRHHNPKAKILYDTVDLHYVRLKRAWELLDDSSEEKKSLEREWRGMQEHELHMARQANVTLTVTPVEKDALHQQGIEKVEVVPNIHQPYLGESKSFLERQGILFIGGYKHVPNIDCVEWLCKSIMPIVWQTLPDIKVTLLGSHPTEAVKQLASDKVTVTGYVKDVTPYFLSSRVFVSPLRFGAGMKGKIGQSLEYGLPVISTKVGAEGIGLTDEHDVLIADDEQHFARQIIRLHEDEQLWNRLASNSHKAILPYTAEYIQSFLSKLFDQI